MSRILFVEPFYGGSHKAFADGLRAHSRHDIQLLTLPEGEWRRRMRRGAIDLAEKAADVTGSFDALMATDMLDVPLFLALTRPRFGGLPVLYYLHENQFTYPRRKGTKLNSWYGQVNYTSALAADAVAFNSSFHRSDFLRALERLSCQPTNWLVPQSVAAIERKSKVLPVGLDFEALDAGCAPPDSGPPIILWNHRWEFDKAPGMFVRTMLRLAGEGVAFRLAIAGDPGDNPYPGMEDLGRELADRIVQFGRAESRDEYATLLHRSHVAVSTARQEFFGIAMVEAMRAACFPVAPRNLNYPEIVPPELHDLALYDDEDDFAQKLRAALDTALSPATGELLREHAGKWAWERVALAWDEAIDRLIARDSIDGDFSNNTVPKG